MRYFAFVLCLYLVFENASAQNKYGEALNADCAETICVIDSLNDPFDDKVCLPDITDSISIYKLHLPDGLYASSVERIYIDSGLLFVVFHQRLLCFNTDGELLFELGTRKTQTFGNKANAFFVDTRKREIWVSYMIAAEYDVYSYNGELLRTESSVAYPFEEFVVTGNAVCTYNGESRVYGLGLDDQSDFWSNVLNVIIADSIHRYLPLDRSERADDADFSSRYGTTLNFSSLMDSYSFHFLYSDVIYSIDRRTSAVSPKYRMDFGSRGYPGFSSVSLPVGTSCARISKVREGS